ncbi:post-PEP-CTERM-1 domain-containing protein [Rubrivivax rivuli]|uniref:Secreted protein n=1 Tax=Rubrivivax rivuli TaxID=1862385 RepID=A0A437RC91_9BURK|nr:hypothetical protein [Rubrivivax rivuli]RVU44294.1 hypothetical protein EOE66_16565 [Rubrivivax rivuli]
MKRTFVGSIGVAAAALAMGTAAQAQQAEVRSDGAAQARAAMAASMKAAARGQKVGMITGKLNPQPQKLAGGGVAQELDATTMVYSVARINADGVLEMVCVNGAEAADKALKAPAFAKRVSQLSREQSHVSK